MRSRFASAVLFRVLLLSILGAASTMVAFADSFTINTGPPNTSIAIWGYPNTATYGQTITPVGTTTQLNSFTFYINPQSTPITYRAYVMAWNGTQATGPVLFESGDQVVPAASGMNPYTYNTGGVNLTAGSQYVLFISVSNNYVPGNGLAVVGARSDAPYGGGQFVYINNGGNFGMWTSTPWSSFGAGWDLAFTAELSSPPTETPEPASMLLLVTGFTGVAVRLRKRQRTRKSET